MNTNIEDMKSSSQNLGPNQVRDLSELLGEIAGKTRATDNHCSYHELSSRSQTDYISVNDADSVSFRRTLSCFVSHTSKFCNWSKDMQTSMCSVINIPECIVLKLTKIEYRPI
jgi:hypothetical protein